MTDLKELMFAIINALAVAVHESDLSLYRKREINEHISTLMIIIKGEGGWKTEECECGNPG